MIFLSFVRNYTVNTCEQPLCVCERDMQFVSFMLDVNYATCMGEQYAHKIHLAPSGQALHSSPHKHRIKTT